MFFAFPEDARWNADRQAVEFGVEIGEYSGVVRVPRQVFQCLLPQRPTPASRRTISDGPGSRALPSEKATSAPVDRGWERGNHWTRFARTLPGHRGPQCGTGDDRHRPMSPDLPA
jgi:hypothetical protein